MEHPVFGRIEWHAGIGCWTGRVQLAFFSVYDTVATATCAERLSVANWQTAPDNRYQQGDFELWVISPDGSKPSVWQERAFRHFLENQDTICNRVVDAVFDLYQGTWAFWRETAEPGKQHEYTDDLRVPELHSRDGLRRVIRLEALTVLDFPNDDLALMGFCFQCTWDIEHGIGVLVREGRLVEVGENDITWSAPEFAGKRSAPSWVPTSQQIDENRGVAAIRKLGGTETLDRVQADAPLYVTKVDLRRNLQLNDADLQSLRHFPALRQLELASPRVTDAGLRELRELKDLRTLQLSGTGITDAGLKELRALTNLKVLQLAGTKITDAGMKEVHELKNLTLLHLSGTHITDDGLRELRDHQALTALHLNDTNVTDAGLKEVAALTSLQHLELANTRVTDVGIQELRELRSLLTLDLQGTAITDAALHKLKGFPRLRYLTLSRTAVTDEGLKELQEMDSLRTLKLQSTATTDAGVADLQRALPRLQVIR